MKRMNLYDKNNTHYWFEAETDKQLEEWSKQLIGLPNFLPEREVANEDGSITVIPQEYIVEIVDLSLDKEFQYNLALEKRKQEYSKFKDEMLEVLIEKELGQTDKLSEILAKYEKVKTDIPLPEKGIKIK